MQEPFASWLFCNAQESPIVSWQSGNVREETLHLEFIPEWSLQCEMNERAVHLNFNTPAGHGAGRPDWIRLCRFMAAGQTPPLQEDTTKASYSHYPLGPPSRTPPTGGKFGVYRPRAFMTGVLPARLNRQTGPTYRLCESCTVSPTWHTMRPYCPLNYWAGPSCSLSTRTFVRAHVCVCMHAHTHLSLWFI